MNQTLFFICCSQFWADFWPNFSSTMLGLLLGLPLALWTNRIIMNMQNRHKHKEENQRLKNALQIIRQTLSENNIRLQNTITTLNNSQVQFDVQLDISAWDVVQGDIIQHLHDSNLTKRIAYHFARLNSTAKLNTMYLDFSAGIASAIGGNENTRDALKNHLITTVNFLINDIIEILPLIDEKLTTK